MSRVALFIRGIAAALIAFAVPTQAAPLVFEGTGAVTRINPLAGSTPTGSIAVGDTLTFRLVFDPVVSSRIFDGGSNLQAFAQPLSEVSATIGGYTFSLGLSQPPAVLLGQGFRLFPGQSSTEPAFTQQFVLPGNAAGNSPFTGTAGGGTTLSLQSVFRIPGFGPTPTIADLRAPNADPTLNVFNLSVFGATPGVGGFVEGNFTGTLSPLAAVPEPSAWALLIPGFGILGTALRNSRRQPNTAGRRPSARHVC